MPNDNRPKSLTATFVRRVSSPGRYGDGRGGFGLSLLVKPMSSTGRLSKSWSQRVRINGHVTNIGLGAWPIVTLAEARRKAIENRRAIEQGKDPRGGGVPTFEQAVENVNPDSPGDLEAGWQERGAMEVQHGTVRYAQARADEG